MTDDDTVTVELPEGLYERFVELKEQFDKLKEELDNVDLAIRAFLQTASNGHNVAVHHRGTFVGGYTRVDSLRLDSGKLRTEQPSIYDAYVKPSTTWRLAWNRGDR